MERLTLNGDQQAEVNAQRARFGAKVGDPVGHGTNLVAGDHVQFSGQFHAEVIRGEPTGGVDVVIVEWWEWGLTFPMVIDLVPHLTDRAGPNGETMPIYDVSAMLAQGDAADPTKAAKEAERGARAQSRDFKSALRDAIKRLPQDQAKASRRVLSARGVLDASDAPP